MASETMIIDQNRIIHETVEDEVIIIDMETGSYFSLRQAGAELWPAIVEGASKDQLTALLGSIYEAQPSDIEASVAELLERLVEEEIIMARPDTGNATIEIASTGAPAKRPFEPPRLEKYTNMSDMLLLDPIHDVGELGWPSKKLD